MENFSLLSSTSIVSCISLVSFEFWLINYGCKTYDSFPSPNIMEQKYFIQLLN